MSGSDVDAAKREQVTAAMVDEFRALLGRLLDGSFSGADLDIAEDIETWLMVHRGWTDGPPVKGAMS